MSPEFLISIVSPEFVSPEFIFEDRQSGFFSALYGTPDRNRFVLAFRGSDESVDWTDTNFPAVLEGEGTQYKEAVAVARVVSENAKLHGYKLSFTGHSLGGGLASVATLATGNESYVFNPAKLTGDLVKGLGLNFKYGNRVHSTVVRGEIVNEFSPGKYASTPNFIHAWSYKWNGNELTQEKDNSYNLDSTTRHGIDIIMSSMSFPQPKVDN